MKRFFKTVLLGSCMLCTSGFLWGQTPQRTAMIEYDLRQIANFDERVLFAQQLVNDPRFQVMTAEQDGLLFLCADDAFEAMDLEEAFKDFNESTRAQLARMDKVEKAEAALRCKTTLPKELLLSLMMEVYNRSRDNNLCAGASPFCTDQGMYMFPAGVDAGSGETGPNYHCLSSTPNPAWYYMRIANPGGFTIHMYSTPSHDIDYCCWGPFDDPVEPCPYGLTYNKVVSCSFSPNAQENCVIPNAAQTGEYYLLVITNYSNQSCNINFSKTAGQGTTDCSILPPLVNNDGPYCTGETIHLTGNAPAGAVYSWRGPNGFTANGQEVSLPNATPEMTGTYICTITLNGQSSSADTYVEVNNPPAAVAQATPDEVSYGTSTTLVSSQQMNSYVYHWEPADKVVNPDAWSTSTVALIEDTRFSLQVTDSRTGCSTRSSVNVWVTSSALTATVDVDDELLCLGEQTTLHAYPHNGAPNIQFAWSPTEGIDDPHAQHPVATPATPGNYEYTCTVSDGYTNVERTVQFSVGDHYYIPMEDYFCHGDSYEFLGQTFTTPGHYPINIPTYLYGCDSIIDLELTMLPTYRIPLQDQFCEGETYEFFGRILTEAGYYTENIPTYQYGCDSIFELELTMLPTYTSSLTKQECDSYTWSFPGNNHYDAFSHTYVESSPEGGYVETVPTVEGCDSTAVLDLHLEYTPIIQQLEGKTWVVGGSEFHYSIESYQVKVDSKAKHHTTWAFGDPDFKRWDLVQHGPNNDSCTLYIYTFETDSIELVAHTFSDCHCGGDTHSIWIHCGYYGVDEQTVQAEILPNPNDGSMHIRCEGMTGDVEIKVFDLTGRLVDRFTLQGNTGFYQAGRCAPGVYCFALTSREGTLMKKVIIVE
ncbi:MAG: T9SS type A sorting domain-containing protein [Bacteroidales bacterium]|nr:T9SS type A sorting domain-containing protein [Bacteroidales bacterium]